MTGFEINGQQAYRNTMTSSRVIKRACRLACLLAAGLFMPCANAQGQPFPGKPVKIVVTFPPGGTVDILARALGQKMSEGWGQSVIVENRVGASGIIGTEYVARSPADGYTLLICAITHVTTASIYSKLPFDPIRDFTPLSLLASSPMILVINRTLPVNSVSELIKLAKARPGELNFGSGGTGTSQHLAAELFKIVAGVDMSHVPYKGGPIAMIDLIGGQIQLMIDQLAAAYPYVKSGKVKALAVTSLKRSAAVPEIPSVAEAGVRGYEMTIWFGALGPAQLPKDFAEKLSGEFARALKSPDIVQRLSSQGLDLQGTSPGQFDAFLRKELAKWNKVIKTAKIKAD
jgi:tripartite-type tricarboxylate transporter receptor subunit TctC